MVLLLLLQGLLLLLHKACYASRSRNRVLCLLLLLLLSDQLGLLSLRCRSLWRSLRLLLGVWLGGLTRVGYLVLR
jgi:hypothetical protein